MTQKLVAVEGVSLSCETKDLGSVWTAKLDPFQFHVDVKVFQITANGYSQLFMAPIIVQKGLTYGMNWLLLGRSDHWVIGSDFNVCSYESERLLCTR